MKAKRVLLRHLGLLKEDDPVDETTLAKYAALFERPLAEDIIQAFADFFGWQLPSALPETARATNAQLIEA